MTTRVKYRASAVRVVAIGQSLSIRPTVTNNWVTKLMGGRGIPYSVGPPTVFAGISLLQLKADPYKTIRNAEIARSDKSIGVIVGGTTDALFNRTAQQMYDDMGTIATDCKTAGMDYVIGTTIQPCGDFTSPQTDAVSGASGANSKILADASHYFDAKVDLATDSRLSDFNNTTYYDTDKTHPTSAGAQVMADLLAGSVNAELVVLGA